MSDHQLRPAFGILTLLLVASACPGCPERTSDGPAAIADPTLPGLGRGDAALDLRLREALASKGEDYRPRTHHLQPDGSASFVNRLIQQTSPYLLQHAHNPVNWYPWGEQAFARAIEQDKPVLLSVGYSTCHWCHVMERESFEDLEIAAFINTHLVAIKVDREERPDVDAAYMKAVQILSGRGGWPMTVLLTPEREPFFGGTYFPARDGDRGSRQGFLSILRELTDEYRTDRQHIVTRARRLTERIRAAAAPAPPGDVPGAELIVRAARRLALSFDPRFGGFGAAPKFPRPGSLDLLMRYHRRTSDPQARQIVTSTLAKMAAGGIYDQIGGGFHRYATDARWLVPHFEKMLYDNAQLATLYLTAYQVTHNEDFATVARETLRYIEREMTAPGGAFYSATDADSPRPDGEEEEGYFFTWTIEELQAALGADSAAMVSAFYGVGGPARVEARSILYRPRAVAVAVAEAAEHLGLSLDELAAKLDAARGTLYEVRSQRQPPLRDDKILTAWNGLMITAFARATSVFGEPTYARRAEAAAAFVLREMRMDNERLQRSNAREGVRLAGYLDDYAFFIAGLLDLYDATSDPRWVEEALSLQAVQDAGFWDDAGGGYFMTEKDREAPLARDKPLDDGAEPSGNSIAVMNLLRLAQLTTDERFMVRAERSFAAFAASLARAPTRSVMMLSALEAYYDTPREIFVIVPEGDRAPEALLNVVRRTYLPNRLFSQTASGAALERRARSIPTLAGKNAMGDRATAYVCERGRCELPTSDPKVLAKQLARIEPLAPSKDLPALPAPTAP